MGHLPVPADMFFSDFASDVLEYNVLSNNVVTGTYRGLTNSDEGGDYIGFLVSDHPQISSGNVIRTMDGFETFRIRTVSYDRYNGKPELLKAYY